MSCKHPPFPCVDGLKSWGYLDDDGAVKEIHTEKCVQVFAWEIVLQIFLLAAIFLVTPCCIIYSLYRIIRCLCCKQKPTRILLREETNFVHKECWIIYQPYYGVLRGVPGCERLQDLTATLKDAENAKKIALRMGIPFDNIKKLTNLTYEDFDEVYKNTYKTLKKNALKDKRSFLMVYCAVKWIRRWD